MKTDPFDRLTFCDRLRQARGSESIRSLARRSGVEHATIIRAERGQTIPGLAAMVRLSKATGKSLDWFVS